MDEAVEFVQAWELGRRVFEARGGRVPGLVLVRTDHSWCEGCVSPELWAAALAGLFEADLPPRQDRPAAKTVAKIPEKIQAIAKKNLTHCYTMAHLRDQYWRSGGPARLCSSLGARARRRHPGRGVGTAGRTPTSR